MAADAAVGLGPGQGNKMAEQVGPAYYDTSGVAAVLGTPGAEPLSERVVGRRRDRRTVLALLTAEGRWIYPTWQFRGHDVLPGLPDVLAAFGPSRAADRVGSGNGAQRPQAVAAGGSTTRVEPWSAWSVATWMTTALHDLGGLSVAQWLAEGRDRDRVVELARRRAAAWAL